jgi:hypothetical protein
MAPPRLARGALTFQNLPANLVGRALRRGHPSPVEPGMPLRSSGGRRQARGVAKRYGLVQTLAA